MDGMDTVDMVDNVDGMELRIDYWRFSIYYLCECGDDSLFEGQISPLGCASVEMTEGGARRWR